MLALTWRKDVSSQFTECFFNTSLLSSRDSRSGLMNLCRVFSTLCTFDISKLISIKGSNVFLLSLQLYMTVELISEIASKCLVNNSPVFRVHIKGFFSKEAWILHSTQHMHQKTHVHPLAAHGACPWQSLVNYSFHEILCQYTNGESYLDLINQS